MRVSVKTGVSGPGSQLSVAVAVPLTANMYSVKFLDFFIKDPVNMGVLGLVVFATFENAWTAYLIRDGFVPVFALQVACSLLLLCSAAFLPYIFYVFRFLHPNTLLRRLEHQFEDAIASALRRPRRLAHERSRVAEVLGALLDAYAVADLSVLDPPLEQVIARVFEEGRAGHDAA